MVHSGMDEDSTDDEPFTSFVLQEVEQTFEITSLISLGTSPETSTLQALSNSNDASLPEQSVTNVVKLTMDRPQSGRR